MVLLSEKELKIQKYNSSKWQARSNPDLLKQSANEKMDAYTDMLVQVIKDPMGVLESIGQSISDTVEEEGIMYVTGYGASAFVPIVGQARAASVVRVGQSALNQKVRDIVRNHKAFEGFKTKPVEFVRNAMNEVAGGIRALQHQLNHGIVPAMSEVPNTPINTLSTRALMNTADETLSRVVGKGTGEFSKYDVGLYKEIKGVPGLDAHHVGQKAIMKKFIRNYDPNNAPAILVPKAGHTRKGPMGIVLRSSKGIESVRQLLARDIMELRRVYPDIPNSQLRKLIKLNKQLYPEMRRR